MQKLSWEKREALVDQAISLLIEEDFTLRKLSDATKIATSNIYRYFPDHPGLLSACLYQAERLYLRDVQIGYIHATNFNEGIWMQWLQRSKQVRMHPQYFEFREKFPLIPLIRVHQEARRRYQDAEKRFLQRYGEKRKMLPLRDDVFRALAYGPLYALLRLHLYQCKTEKTPFHEKDIPLSDTFDHVLLALHPRKDDLRYSPYWPGERFC
jgi:TetR/AcrR family transcriptional regulator, multidrug resistance operon repressor